MVYILILIMAPVLIIIVIFLRKQITLPIGKLVEASKEMESGKLGVIIDGKDMPNQQFQYLQDSFNKMSKQVQYLFDYAYDEKLARKDAKILALKAQINPHFLNNTLEIMNWQAPMSGDAALCKMINSLFRNLYVSKYLWNEQFRLWFYYSCINSSSWHCCF